MRTSSPAGGGRWGGAERRGRVGIGRGAARAGAGPAGAATKRTLPPDGAAAGWGKGPRAGARRGPLTAGGCARSCGRTAAWPQRRSRAAACPESGHSSRHSPPPAAAAACQQTGGWALPWLAQAAAMHCIAAEPPPAGVAAPEAPPAQGLPTRRRSSWGMAFRGASNNQASDEPASGLHVRPMREWDGSGSSSMACNATTPPDQCLTLQSDCPGSAEQAGGFVVRRRDAAGEAPWFSASPLHRVLSARQLDRRPVKPSLQSIPHPGCVTQAARCLR